MDQHFRFQRAIGSLAALIAAGLFVAAPITLSAQQAWQPELSLKASGVASEPVVVIKFSSVENVINDTSRLATAIGRTQEAGLLRMSIGMFKQRGVDPTQPAGVLVPLSKGFPQPLAAIPANDIKLVLSALKSRLGDAEPLEDGTLVVKILGVPIYFKQQGDWAFAAVDRDHFSSAPADPKALLDSVGGDLRYSASVRPGLIIEQLGLTSIEILRNVIEMVAGSRLEVADVAIAGAESQVRAIAAAIKVVDSLTAGVDLDWSSKRVSLTVAVGLD
jgi:hypothetical protein